MREILGLVVFLSFSIIILYLGVTKKIGPQLTVALIIVFLGAGFVIAKLDSIIKFKGAGFVIESFQEKVTTIKDKAIKDIQDEVKAQEESIKLLIAEVNNSREKLDSQEESIKSFVSSALGTEKKIIEHRQNIEIGRASCRERV